MTLLWDRERRGNRPLQARGIGFGRPPTGFGAALAPALLSLLLACQGQPALEPTPTPSVVVPDAGQAGRVRLEVVAQGLEVPWALAFAPDGRLFFTERPGRIRVIVQGKLVPQPVAELPVTAVVESGLHGLALDPRFGENGYLYVYYTYREGQSLWNRVVRLTEREGRATQPMTLLDRIPGANIHDGGRMKFGPDGKLYITSGDAAQPELAQRLDSLAGKILRLNPDGSIPTDNPFPGSPVYSYGHRNPQGLAWHPGSGALYSTEHGAVGNDELNRIEPGKNYGWPRIQGTQEQAGLVTPLAVYTPAVAPAGAVFYQGNRYSGWEGNLFFATLRGEHLHRLALAPPDFVTVQEEERLFLGQLGRLRDVALGPDGYLYLATSNRDGRGTPAPQDDRILRLVP